jgi:hypothetical protein
VNHLLAKENKRPKKKIEKLKTRAREKNNKTLNKK